MDTICLSVDVIISAEVTVHVCACVCVRVLYVIVLYGYCNPLLIVIFPQLHAVVQRSLDMGGSV